MKDNYPCWIESTKHNPSSPVYSDEPSCTQCKDYLSIEHGDHETPTLKWCDNLSCEMYEMNV